MGTTSEVRWLSEDEQGIWRAFVTSMRMLMDAFERDLQQGAAMPFAYYEVLVRLSEAGDHTLRMSDLAESSQTSRSRLSHAIARLEEAGLVRRERCESDRRGAYAALTPAGMDALVAAAPVHVASVRSHLFDQLSQAELHQLGSISRRLLQHLAPSHVCASRGLGDHPECQVEDAASASGRQSSTAVARKVEPSRELRSDIAMVEGPCCDVDVWPSQVEPR